MICQKTWPREAGLIFSIYLYRKQYKSFCQKPLDRFQYNSSEILLWRPSTKIVQAMTICEKHVAAWGRGLFSLYICSENCKNLLARNHWTNLNIILQCFFLTLYQDCSSHHDSSKIFATRGGAYFSCIAKQKILLVETTGPVSI